MNRYLSLLAISCSLLQAAQPPPASAQYHSEHSIPMEMQQGVVEHTPPAKKVFVPTTLTSLELADGKVYKEVRVTAENPTHVTIRHAGGMAQIEKLKLPVELQEKYPYDPEGARMQARSDSARRSLAKMHEANRTAKARSNQVAAAAEQASRDAQSEIATASEEQRIQALAEREVRYYFRHKWNPGNSSVMVIESRVTVDEITPSQGWTGHYNIRGTAFIEYYMSSGSSVTRHNLNYSGEMVVSGRNVKLDIRAR